MGQSGAGKSTLLDILAGRKKEGRLAGYLAVSGKERPGNFSQISGYVMQDEVFISTLTVREVVYHALCLRLPVEKFLDDPDQSIFTILRTLGLENRADTRIGDSETRGISGGERRRLSIAVEIVINPELLFMDEPTTGLDATNALKLFVAVKELSNRGQTIVTTIHQPRSDIFEMFDYLLLLDGGRTVYYGFAKDVDKYFSSFGYACPEYVNVADFLLDIFDSEVKLDEKDNDENETDTRVILRDKDSLDPDEFPKAFAESEANSELNRKIKHISRYGTDLETEVLNTSYPVSTWTQFKVLFKRNAVAAIRDSNVLYIRTIAAFGIALLVGTIFFGQPEDSSSHGARLNSLLFMMCMLCYLPLIIMIEERLLFNREVAGGYYSAGPYFIASQCVEIPVLTLTVLIYTTISYWMIGLEANPTNFLFCLAMMFVVINTGFSVAQLVTAATGTISMSCSLYGLFTVWNLLMGGFIVHRDMMPLPLRWMIYTSYFFYGFEGLIVNEFERRDDFSGIVLGMDMRDANKFENLGILTLHWVLVLVIVFFFLKYANKEKR